MQSPQVFSYADRASIPTDRGIYAFYLDLRYMVNAMRQPGSDAARLDQLIDKVVRSRTASNPNNVQFNVFGRTKTFTAVYELQATHMVQRGSVSAEMTREELQQLARTLQKCEFFLSPMYIGIAERQSLAARYDQHRAKYNRLKASGNFRKGIHRDTFERCGSFPHNLVQRGIEFRHLLFACFPLTSEEIGQVRFVEKLFHAVVNPPLSESH